MTNDMIDNTALETETRRLCQRYIDEVVLPFNLCPWAAPALQKSAVQMAVITDTFSGTASYAEAAERVLSALNSIQNDEIELVLVLLPRCRYSRLDMDDVLREIRQRTRPVGTHERSRIEAEQGEATFALAAFHPDAAPDTTTGERLIPYLRRTPDPMIQAVRSSTLAKIDPDRGTGTAFFNIEEMSLDQLNRSPKQPLRARVANANLETCLREGLSSLEARFNAILEDHAVTRARLSSRGG